MSGGRRRGRPRKQPFFKSGARLNRKLPMTALGAAMRSGQREFFAALRKANGCGPHIPIDAILEVMRFDDGDPLDDAKRQQAEGQLRYARSRDGGTLRGASNMERRREVLRDHCDLFKRVMGKKLTANRGAELLRARLANADSDAWVPSIRTLNSWFAAAVDEKSGG